MPTSRQIAGESGGGPLPIRIGVHGDQLREPKAILSSAGDRYPAIGFANPPICQVCGSDSGSKVDIQITGVARVNGVTIKGFYPTQADSVEFISGDPVTVY